MILKRFWPWSKIVRLEDEILGLDRASRELSEIAVERYADICRLTLDLRAPQGAIGQLLVEKETWRAEAEKLQAKLDRISHKGTKRKAKENIAPALG